MDRGRYYRLNSGFYTSLTKVLPIPDSGADTTSSVANADLEKLIRENMEMTRSVHRVLVGEPEFKRKGLVEIVDWHNLLLTRGGGGILACGLIYGALKAFGLLH